MGDLVQKQIYPSEKTNETMQDLMVQFAGMNHVELALELLRLHNALNQQLKIAEIQGSPSLSLGGIPDVDYRKIASHFKGSSIHLFNEVGTDLTEQYQGVVKSFGKQMNEYIQGLEQRQSVYDPHV